MTTNIIPTVDELLSPLAEPNIFAANRILADKTTRIAVLEKFVRDVMHINTFTDYGRTPEENTPLRTPLGNRAAVLLGLPEHPTQGGLDTSLDSVS